MRWTSLGALAALWPALVLSYASTDSIQDADAAQSGYLPNHNIDPNVVGGSSFGILWQTQVENSQETWYAKPLTYTINGGREMVITASNMNIVRIHDSKNGTLLAQRQVQLPFLTSDLGGCNDIPNYIGITGTPLIDPATDIIYMVAKGYKDGSGSGGMANAAYRMHALQLPSLQPAPGFPVTVEGPADNGPERYFIAGVVLQRPSLATVNGAVLAAFGGHCDGFNYTGVIASVSKTPGVGLLSMYAMEVFPGAPTPQGLVMTSENGAGKAGIWQSGFGLATDTGRIFAVTGNGKGHQNGNVPASGRLPMNTLDECAASFTISADGKIRLADYFQPYDYVNLDAADQELGSSGLALLDPTVFKTSTVSRLGVTVGKNSKVYIMNADNLGGFKQGTGGTDNVVQIIKTTNSVFGGVGSYPLEGGYLYFTPVGDVTYAYKFGQDAAGNPVFTLAGKTATSFAGRPGNGVATVTTNAGKAGTGILWVADVNTGLKAFKAVPDANGVLQPITLPATPGINKYQRPAFGDGRVFATATNRIFCMGAPVNLPINCTGPIDFGNVQTGDTATQQITCKANVQLTKVNGCTTGDKLFQCSNSTLPQGTVAAGTSFTFPVIWNLTQKAINDAQNVSYGRVLPGVEGAVLNLFTTNSVTGYSSQIPISLSGTVVSSSPFLFMSPTAVDFGGLVLGSDSAADGLTGDAVVQNIGNSTLTITGVAWQLGEDLSGPFHNATYNGISATFGDQGFSATEFVKAGQQIEPGASVSVPLVFNTDTAGTYAVTVTLWSDGGVDTIVLSASAGNPAIASLAVSTDEGGWDKSTPVAMHFGNVLAGKTVTKKIQLCNVGGSVLTVSKSKPPSTAQLTATNPYSDLVEGQKIDVDDCAYGTVAVYAAPVQPNHPSQYLSVEWVLNTDGLDALHPTQEFGVRDIAIDATVVSRQIGPLLANGTGRYQYVGCFKDTSSLGRNLQMQINTAAQQSNNTNEQCQTLCYAAGYAIAATQYQKECWCGNSFKNPSTMSAESLNLCTFACPGDGSESCGGDNGYMSAYADIAKFDIPGFYASLNKTSTPTASGTATSAGSAPTVSSSGSALNPLEPATVAGSWTYIGCHQDNLNGQRSLSAASTTSATLTLDQCAAYCSKYNYFGTEYGSECYCGYTLNSTLLRATEADCSTSCGGSSSQLCGSGNRLSVYSNQIVQTPPAQPSHVAQAGNYGWKGCYTEATSGRALNVNSYADDSMTVDICAAFCAKQNAGAGTTWMGIEYARECFCGNLPGAGSILTDTSACSMLCKNNTLQYCGAGGKLDMYSLLPASSATTSSASSTATSSSVGTSVVATTTSSSSSASIATTSGSSRSSSALSSTVSSTSVVSSTSTSSSSSTSSAPSATLSHKARVGGYNMVSCWTEGNGVRALDGPLYGYDTLTLEDCAANCTSGGYKYFGAEYGRECWCGNNVDKSSAAAPLADCNMVCGGNHFEYCGAGNRLELYSLGPAVSSTSSSSTSSVVTTTSSASSSSSSLSTSSSASSSGSSSPTSISSSSSSTGSPSSTSSSSSTSSTPSTSSTSSSSLGSSSSTVSSSTSTSTSSTSSSSSSSSSSVSSTSTSSSTSSSSSSSTPGSTRSSTTTTSSSSSSSSIPASTSVTTTSSSSTSSTSTLPPSTSSTSSLVTATPTAGYYPLGCFSDTSSGHALPLLVTNSSMTPELCLSAANSIGAAKPTPTKFPFVYIEYHGQCYGGTSLDFKSSAVTSLYGANACTDWCSGSRIPYTTNGVVKTSTLLDNRCGGAKQFNLYAAQTDAPLPTTGGPVMSAKAP